MDGLAKMRAQGMPVMHLLIEQIEKHAAEKGKRVDQQTSAPLDLSVTDEQGIPLLSQSVRARQQSIRCLVSMISSQCGVYAAPLQHICCSS